MIALTTAQIISIVIFLIVMILIISEKVHRTTAALAGAVALILAGIITTIDDLPAVQNAFGGIRVCVCVLIFNAICKLWKGAIKGPLSVGIFLVVALGSYFLSISPAIFVVAAGLIGIVLELTGARKSTDTRASDSISSDKKGGDQA